jgi:hypothetical protein
MWNPFKREIVVRPIITVLTDPAILHELEEQNRFLASIEEQIKKLVAANGPRVINLSQELQERLSQMVRPQ